MGRHWTFGLRKVDLVVPTGWVAPSQWRRGMDRRRAVIAPAPAYRSYLARLWTASLGYRRPECCLGTTGPTLLRSRWPTRSHGSTHACGRDGSQGELLAGTAGDRWSGRSVSRRDLRWAAPANSHCPHTGHEPRSVADGRALLVTRRPDSGRFGAPDTGTTS